VEALPAGAGERISRNSGILWVEEGSDGSTQGMAQEFNHSTTNK